MRVGGEKATRASDSIPGVIDSLYAGTLDAEQWTDALRGSTDLVGGCGLQLFAIDPSRGGLLRNEAISLDPQILREYAAYWNQFDPFFAPMRNVAAGEVYPEHALVQPAEYEHTAFYRDFMRVHDTTRLLVGWVHKSPTKWVALSVKATSRHGAFTEGDCERIAAVVPHLRQALEIRDRLENATISSRTLLEQLDRAGPSALLLDDRGRVLECSPEATRLLGRRQGVAVAADGTLALRGAAQRDLAHWLSTGRPPAHSRDGLIRVPGIAAGAALTVLIAPMQPGSVRWVGADPRWLVLCFDPQRRIRVSAELIASHWAISPREGEITALLVSGHRPAQIAEQLRVSEQTVRTHLKHIFGKVGVSSQSELVACVLGSGIAPFGPLNF